MPKPDPNPNVPAILMPTAEIDNLASFGITVKEAVESLAGHRGDPLDRAVTFRDLIALGLITELMARGQRSSALVYATNSKLEALQARLNRVDRRTSSDPLGE